MPKKSYLLVLFALMGCVEDNPWYEPVVSVSEVDDAAGPDDLVDDDAPRVDRAEEAVGLSPDPDTVPLDVLDPSRLSDFMVEANMRMDTALDVDLHVVNMDQVVSGNFDDGMFSEADCYDENHLEVTGDTNDCLVLDRGFQEEAHFDHPGYGPYVIAVHVNDARDLRVRVMVTMALVEVPGVGYGVSAELSSGDLWCVAILDPYDHTVIPCGGDELDVTPNYGR